MIKKVMEDYKVLLRSIPAATVSLFFVSVIMMNLLANKELISLPYLALDCGFVVSWVSFLCQDMICKRFGAKASIKISILALAVNLAFLGGCHDTQRGEETHKLLFGLEAHDGFDECGVVIPLRIN